MSVTIDGQEKLDEFLRRLTDPAELRKFSQNVGVEFGNKAKVILEDYPGPSHSPVIWASNKQRAWYFASRRNAGLPMEYDRITDPTSKQVGMNWAVKKTVDGAIVGNTVDYSAYVQGHQHQSAQHKATGWVTEKDAAEQTFEQNMVQIIDKEMQKVLKGLTSGLGV